MPDAPMTGAGETRHALEMLREDHQRIQELIRQYRREMSPDNRVGIADNLLAELETHSLLEREFIYPALRRLAGDESIVDLAEEEHREAELLVEQIQEIDPSDQEFDALFSELATRVTNHLRDEEGELFARLEKLGDEELIAIGKKMQDRRAEALRELQDSRAAGMGTAE